MGLQLRDIDVLEELYTEENPSEINLKNLANLLGLTGKDLAGALHIDATVLSRNPYDSSNKYLKQWMMVFNLIITIIADSEPSLSDDQIKVKMQRWLKLPRPEFQGDSALEYMIKGKIRRVKNLLEQVVA